MIAFQGSSKFAIAWCWKTKSASIIFNNQAIFYHTNYIDFFDKLVQLQIAGQNNRIPFKGGYSIYSCVAERYERDCLISNELFKIKAKVKSLVTIYSGVHVEKVPVFDSEIFMENANIFSEDALTALQFKF